MFQRALTGVVCVVLLAACSVDEGAEQQQLQTAPVSLFDPVSLTGVIVPLPFDAFFAGFNDPTLNIPNSSNAPFVTAANLVDGWSTAAPIFTDLVGFVDLDTANNGQGVLVIDTSVEPPASPVLIPGVDYVVQGYPALDDADGVPINEKRTRLLIQPLRPLKPETRYVVALTRALTNDAGENALPSEQFLVAASDTPVSEQSAPILDFLTAGQQATLETLRSQIIRPTVEGLAAAGIAEQSLVLAWPFTTQSIGKTLASIQENVAPSFLGVQPVPNGAGGTLNTGDLGLGLPPNADIYAGVLDVPYYGQLPSEANPTAPLTAFWQASDAMADTDFEASFAGVPCSAFFGRATLPNGITVQPSASTTTCFPVPVAQSTQRIPVLVTVPNTSAPPAGGWRVAIFQHGITQNRSNLFPIAPALAQAGIVGIAIDHPLHGVAPCTVGTAGCLRIDGVSERTFDVDYVNNATSAPGPDGTPDASGTHYLNLSSLITGRDNVRQSVADLIQLHASLGALNADSDPQNDINTSQVGFIGHSLGGIVGGTFAGVNTDVGPVSLANPGGGIAKLLDGSLNFGPVVAAGLAAAGFNEGGDTFETFLRFAQLVIDDGDPINYATAAAENHPIHMISVDGDTVVPNNVPAGPTTDRNHLVTIPGPLSGTDPLAAAMGPEGLEVIPVTPGVTSDVRLDPAGVRAVTVLDAGDHGSILDPGASLAATVEIQSEIATFQATGGACLPIGEGSCTAPPPTAQQ